MPFGLRSQNSHLAEPLGEVDFVEASRPEAWNKVHVAGKAPSALWGKPSHPVQLKPQKGLNHISYGGFYHTWQKAQPSKQKLGFLPSRKNIQDRCRVMATATNEKRRAILVRENMLYNTAFCLNTKNKKTENEEQNIFY